VFPREGKAIMEEVQQLLRMQNLAVTEIQLERGRLDEVFRQITSGMRAA
jgi:ABC-2 type transport system ATP-binding protein